MISNSRLAAPKPSSTRQSPAPPEVEFQSKPDRKEKRESGQRHQGSDAVGPQFQDEERSGFHVLEREKKPFGAVPEEKGNDGKQGKLAKGVLRESQRMAIAFEAFRQAGPRRREEAGDEDQRWSEQRGQHAARPEEQPENRGDAALFLNGFTHRATHSVNRSRTSEQAPAASVATWVIVCGGTSLPSTITFGMVFGRV